MIVEKGVVKKVDDRGAWVETIRQSTCKSCRARKGCGQRLVNEFSGETTLVHALYSDTSPPLHINQVVQIGVPREVVALGSLWLYLMPVVLLVIGALTLTQFLGPNLGAGLGAFIGLFFGGVILIKQAKTHYRNPKVHPTILPDTVNTDLL